MKIKFILPALTEATSPHWRPIKYALFPPLGLATLAAFCRDDDEVTLEDEHVEAVRLDDAPALVAIQVYITNAHRAYALADHYRARGAHVVLGGLHVTSLPEEAAAHADTLILGPAEATFPAFLADLRAGRPQPRYQDDGAARSLHGIPPIRRDLLKRHLYLVPNSIVVSRGCPHHCTFCYKDAFFEGGRGFYTQQVDEALAEISRLPGKHLYFLDDHLLGNPRFARDLFAGMRGMGRLFQGASTVDAVLRGDLIERAVEAGLRSLFIGFESLEASTLQASNKRQNLGRDYDRVIRRLDDLGVMINGSFVFGLDGDGPDVFSRTVDWAVRQGITTATFHIATPYPGTALFQEMERQGRLWHRDWRQYDTRTVVFTPRGMTPSQLKDGYDRAYRDFYSWANIARGSRNHASLARSAKHLAYAGGWKRLEPLWDAIIRRRHLTRMRPILESVLATVQPQHSLPSPSASAPSHVTVAEDAAA